MSDVFVLEALADALEAAVTTLRQRIALERAGLGAGDVESPSRDLDVVERARAVHPQLGPRQIDILRELDAAEPNGMTTGELGKAIGYDQSNCYLALQGMTRYAQLVVKNERVSPHRYRLGPKLQREPA